MSDIPEPGSTVHFRHDGRTVSGRVVSTCTGGGFSEVVVYSRELGHVNRIDDSIRVQVSDLLPELSPSILAKLDASNDLSNPANRPAREPQDMSAHGVPEVEQAITSAEQRTGVSDVQHAIADEVAALRAMIEQQGKLGRQPSQLDMLAACNRIAALVPQRATATGLNLPLWLHVTCGGTATGHTVPKLTICRKCDTLTGEADWRALYTVPGR